MKYFISNSHESVVDVGYVEALIVDSRDHGSNHYATLPSTKYWRESKQFDSETGEYAKLFCFLRF